MATVGNSNPRRFRPSEPVRSHKPSPLDEILEDRPRLRSRKRFWLFAGGLLALAAIGVALAPTVISKTVLRDRILNAAAGLDGEIDTAGGSLGWFSPIVLDDVAIFDHENTTVVQAGSLTSSSTLLGLLLHPGQPGTFTIERPIVYLELREKGSNLEDVLRPILQAKGESSTQAVGVHITDGVVNIYDRVSRQKYQLQRVKVDLALDKSASPPIQVDASATMPTRNNRASLNVAMRGGDSAGGLEQGTLDCQLEAFPLQVLEPFVRRALPGARLSGLVAANAHGTWGEGGDRGKMSLQGKVLAQDFSLEADALGKDRLTLERIELPCKLEKRGSQLRIDELKLTTDVGQIAVEGTMLVEELSTTGLLAALQSDAYRAEGQLDLARVAALLPDTLRVKEGTEITDGRLQVVLVGERGRDGVKWQGRVETANLRANAQGKRIDWKDPLVLEFAAHHSPDGPVVDRADCTSSFLTLTGHGTLDDFQASGQFDLEKLVGEISQFVNLDGIELAGAGDAKFRLRRKDAERLSLVSDFQATNFVLAIPGQRAWRERSVTARFDADGHIAHDKSGWHLTSIDTAQLTCEAASEKLSVKLLEAVERLSAPLVPVEVNWQGPLGVWLSRIDPWIDTGSYQLDGSGILKATAVYTNEGVDVRNAIFAAEPFRWSGEGLNINERRVDAALSARWDQIASRLAIPSGAIEADTVLVKLSQAEVRIPTRGTPSMAGTLKFDADLRQLNAWTQDPRQPTREMAGKLTGQAEVLRQGRNTSAKLRATIDDFYVAELNRPASVPTGQSLIPGLSPVRRPAPGPQAQGGWRERQITIATTANYQEAEDTLAIERAEITSDALRMLLNGNIKAPNTDCLLDLAGTIDYDWKTLAPFWRPYLGDAVNIVGRESRKFTVRGPLPQTAETLAGKLAPITAEVGLGWDSAEAYGLPIGKGEIVARLDRGVLDVQPMDVSISEGRFTFAPKIRVAPEPGEVRIDKGPLLTQIRLTPEITDRLLKYAAPVLAQTARIDGQFSIDLDGGRLPLNDLRGGDIGGRLTIHNVDVLPGPLAQQILSLGKQVEDLLNGRMPQLGQAIDTKQTLLTVKDQTIDVRMVNRRVYHRGMNFLAGKVPVRTTGSVGLDESLELLAEVDIPQEGVGNGPVVNALKGKTLKIPISGTLSQPKLDDRALTQLGGQLLENTAKGLLMDEVGKQLDRLLPKQ